MLDRDLENYPRFEVFGIFKREELSFDVIKIDFSSSIILLSFNHKFSAILLDLFEVQSFESFRIGLSHVSSDGLNLLLDTGFEFPKNLDRIVLLGVSIKPELPFLKLK